MVSCTACGSMELEASEVRADLVCTNCGFVLEDKGIVTDKVSFAETSSGASGLVGTQVPSGGVSRLRSRVPTLATSAIASEEDSIEASLYRASHIIDRVGDQLSLGRNLVDSTRLLYRLALQSRFVRGRSMLLVAGACVYIVCRREKTSHMLLDVSEALELDVYLLGRIYLQLCYLLRMKLPVIDPSLYIHRFAGALHFESKTHLVAITALRLVARMKRDWILTGRRPAGICGACLLIAARIHGFNRNAKQIAGVVRMKQLTIHKRLMEFAMTPSSNLTLDEFQNSEVVEECNPPCFDADILNITSDDEQEEEAEEEVVKEIETALRSEELEDAGNGSTETSSKNLTVPTPVSTKPVVPTLRIGTEEEFDLEGYEDDAEIEGMLLSTTEQNLKKRLWENMNKEYLQEQAEKAKLQELEEASGVKKRSYKKRRAGFQAGKTAAESTGRALERASSSSSLLNYQALNDILSAGKPTTVVDAISKHNPVLATAVIDKDVDDEEFDDDFLDDLEIERLAPDDAAVTAGYEEDDDDEFLYH